jgi:hypothetical protein
MATGFQIFERRRYILHLERLVDYWSNTDKALGGGWGQHAAAPDRPAA